MVNETAGRVVVGLGLPGWSTMPDVRSKLAPCALVLIAVAVAARPPEPPSKVVPLPDGERGIGFDDLGFSAALDRLLVPSGRTGRLNLVAPETLAVESIAGFSARDRFAGGHGEGTTSADVGRGLVFASDRGRRVVRIVDPVGKRILGEARLGGGPDYVRWVEPTTEVWVTEPGRKAIETFTFHAGDPPSLVPAGAVAVDDGPESLVIDATRGRAYTNGWRDTTFAVDLASREVVARWPNGCEGARGIALDEKRGLLFVGCEEGKAVALDVVHDGKRLGVAETGQGVDIIAYAERLHHLYVPAGDDATLAIVGVGERGDLRVLGTVPTAPDARCVTADDRGNAYVCDPAKGRLLVIADRFPPDGG